MIDYKVGDWVETCRMLPGIVQKIDEANDDVLIFSFDHIINHPGEYCGGSSCSIHHCGVHKITQEYAMKLLSIGEKRLEELWEETKNDERSWSEIVEEEFAKTYKKDLDLYDTQGNS